MEYGKIINGGLTTACNVYEAQSVVDLVSAETQPEGYLPVEKVLPKPTPASGEWLAFRYTNTGTALRKEYYTVPEGTSCKPRSFSVFKITQALKNLDVTHNGETVKAWSVILPWIKENDLYEEYLCSKCFDEDNPIFLSALGTLKALCGVTDEQISLIFDGAVIS
jgi:hypothetical protein